MGRSAAEPERGTGEKARDLRQFGRVERGVGVHEADDVAGGGEQPRVTGGAESSLRLVHDVGTVCGGDVRRAVGGPVVDHDGPITAGHAAENPGQRRRLVEAGQYDVDHARTLSPQNRRRPLQDDDAASQPVTARVLTKR